MELRLKKLNLIKEEEIEALPREKLIECAKLLRQKIMEYEGIVFKLKTWIHTPRSEKSNKANVDRSKDKKPRGDTTKQLSERYNDTKIEENDIDFLETPICPECGNSMSDSGMTEDSEYLTINLKEFMVVQQKRHKHRCSKCHGEVSRQHQLYLE